METMTDTLILHIGLSRTGTTSLQRRFFGQYSNAVTPYSTDYWKKALNDEMSHIFQDCELSAWSGHEGEILRELLKTACSKTSGKPLLISNNALSRPFFFRKKNFSAYSQNEFSFYPFTLHLQELLHTCPWVSRVKVMVTLRNQPTWLGSLYAKDSHLIDGASQIDFEQKVHQLMDDKSLNRGGFLNWGKLVQDIWRIVGKENTYVLLLEEMNTSSYWTTLAEWSELPFDPMEYGSITSKPESARSLSNDGWSISNREFRWPWVVRFLQNYGGLYSVVKYSYGLLKSPFVHYRPEEFTLSDEMASELRAYCDPFNRELAECLGRDFLELQRYGY